MSQRGAINKFGILCFFNFPVVVLVLNCIATLLFSSSPCAYAIKPIPSTAQQVCVFDR